MTPLTNCRFKQVYYPNRGRSKDKGLEGGIDRDKKPMTKVQTLKGGGGRVPH